MELLRMGQEGELVSFSDYTHADELFSKLGLDKNNFMESYRSISDRIVGDAVGVARRELAKISKDTWVVPIDEPAYVLVKNVTDSFSEVGKVLGAIFWDYITGGVIYARAVIDPSIRAPSPHVVEELTDAVIDIHSNGVLAGIVQVVNINLYRSLLENGFKPWMDVGGMHILTRETPGNPACAVTHATRSSYL
jgi:hypothetical protein